MRKREEREREQCELESKKKRGRREREKREGRREGKRGAEKSKGEMCVGGKRVRTLGKTEKQIKPQASESPSHLTPCRNSPCMSCPHMSQKVGPRNVCGRNRCGTSILNLSFRNCRRTFVIAQRHLYDVSYGCIRLTMYKTMFHLPSFFTILNSVSAPFNSSHMHLSFLPISHPHSSV